MRGSSYEGRGQTDQINKENVIEESAASSFSFKKTHGTPKRHQTFNSQNINYLQASTAGAQGKKKVWTPQEVRIRI
jgi:hypothetical protein